MAFLAGKMQCCITVLIRLVDIYIFVYKKFYNIDTIMIAGDEKRCHAVFRRLINIRAFVQKQSRHVDVAFQAGDIQWCNTCLLYTSPSPRDRSLSRMPSSA